jgi:hypothetical protein
LCEDHCHPPKFSRTIRQEWIDFGPNPSHPFNLLLDLGTVPPMGLTESGRFRRNGLVTLEQKITSVLIKMPVPCNDAYSLSFSTSMQDDNCAVP